jgi:hypothetical protein
VHGNRRDAGRAGLLCALIAAGALASAAPAPAAPGRRVTIAVEGDSVVEGALTPLGLTRGLSPQISAALARGGVRRGGPGYLAPILGRFVFSRRVAPSFGPVPAGAWAIFGHDALPPGDGISGYAAVASSATATARIRIYGSDVGVLFTTATRATPFRVEVPGRTYRLDAFAPGKPHSSQVWLSLAPGGSRILTVRGPSKGALVFGGIIDRRPPPAGAVQVESENLGHAALLPQDALAPRITEALAAQRFDITVLLWSYLAELIGNTGGQPDRISADYERGLLARARLARRHGGQCVVADATPIPVASTVSARYAAIDTRVAAEAGCVHTAALAGLWPDASRGFEDGHTLIDDVHPTVPTYRRMAAALAPVLAPMVRRAAATP